MLAIEPNPESLRRAELLEPYPSNPGLPFAAEIEATAVHRP